MVTGGAATSPLNAHQLLRHLPDVITDMNGPSEEKSM